MKTLLLTATALAAFAMPALADTAPVFPGAAGTDCDPAQFTPIFGKNGDVLYWNNPTCQNGQGGMDPTHPSIGWQPPVEDEEIVEEDEPVDETPVAIVKA